MFRGSDTSLFDNRSRRIASRAATFIGLVGMLAVAGWLLDIPVLRRWILSFPDMRPLAIIGLLLLATGIAVLARKESAERRPKPFPALLLIVLGITVFALRLGATQVNLAPDSLAAPRPVSMSLYSAFSFVLAGVALWAMRWQNKSRGSTVAGICGTLLAVLGTGILFAVATNAVNLRENPALMTMSIPLLLSFMVAGITIVSITWRRETSLLPFPGWTAVALGVATMVVTLTFWLAFQQRETEHARSLADSKAEAAQTQITARLDEVMARLCQLGTVARDEGNRWNTAANRFLGAAPALEEIAYGTSHLGGTPITGVLIRDSTREATLPGITETLPREMPGVQVLPAGGSGGQELIFRVPACGEHDDSMFTLSLWRGDKLLELIRSSAVPGYAMSLRAGSQTIFQRDSTRDIANHASSHREFEYAGLQWQLDLVALPGGVNSALSGLPGLVGTLGVLLSILLTLTVALIRVTVVSARESERARLTRGLGSTTEGLWEWHPRTGETVRGNGIWERLGFDGTTIPRDQQTLRWVDLVSADERPRVQALLRDHLEGRAERYEAEYRVTAADGSTHWIADRGQVVERDADGVPLLLVGISADVTERHVAEEGLATRERQFHAVFDSGYHLQWVIDDDGRVVEANRTALAFAKASLDDVAGRNFWETPWWPTGEATRARLLSALEITRGGAAFASEETLRGPDGVAAQVDFSITPIRAQGGSTLQYLAEARDKTERLRIQEALLERDSLSTMGRVAARMSHETNNALASIQNAFLLIRNAVSPAHPHHRYVGLIEQEIARITAITRQLYETYRPERDPGAGSPAHAIITDAVRLQSQINRKRGVTIEVDVGSTPGILPIPATLLRQVVYNLVQNAVDAASAGSVVSVRTWHADGGFWLSVRNAGTSLAPELRKLVLAPYVTTQADLSKPVDRDISGIGLGLSLVRRSVSAMGGHITILDPPDGGTDIQVFIPTTPTGMTTT